VADIPILVAHRGWPARFPENSLEGLAAALETGACCVEFDVQISADGVPVVIHDDNLRRTAGIDRSVLDSTCAALQRERVGEPARFGSRFAGVRPPTLVETVALLATRPRATVFAEIKRASIRRFGHDRVLPPILAALAPIRDHCVAISFDAEAMALARRAGFRIGWAVEEWGAAAQGTASRLAPEYLFCEIGLLPPAPAPIWNGPWTWVAYETGAPAQALALAERGIALVETDSIGEMLMHAGLRTKACRNGR
jgi:glycerophosphoryl diester phosphodiesterase